jgi:hypothetical protein
MPARLSNRGTVAASIRAFVLAILSSPSRADRRAVVEAHGKEDHAITFKLCSYVMAYARATMATTRRAALSSNSICT